MNLVLVTEQKIMSLLAHAENTTATLYLLYVLHFIALILGTSYSTS
jgi:hypothetical protein